jgi:hypothetical protein
MATRWTLSVDFGTSYTAAAMANGSGPEVVEIDGLPRMLSNVFWRDSDAGGHLVLGDEAENSAATEPECFERCPKRRIQDDFLLLGGHQLRVVEAVAKIIEHSAAEAIWRQGGQPGELRLTHPARWQGSRLAKLSEAAALAGFGEVSFVSEPVAAAVHFASARLHPGDRVAVYDLGGGTFDTAVLERTADGFEVIANGGKERLGGEDFDYRLYEYLGEQLPPETWAMLTSNEVPRPWKRANADFRRAVRDAKEKLSKSPDASIYIALPADASLRVTRAELESLIRNDIDTTVTELVATIGRARMAPGDLQAIYLAGGSSRMPIVAQTITEQLEREPSTFGDPKAVTALGAVKTAAAIADAPPVTPPTPPDPEPEAVHPQEERDDATTTESPPPASPPPAPVPQGALQVPVPVVTALALAAIGSQFLRVFGTFTGWSLVGSHTRGIEFIAGFAAVIVLAAIGRGNPRSGSTVAAGAIAFAGVGAAAAPPTGAAYAGLEAGWWITAGITVILALVLGVSVWSYWARRQTQRPARGTLLLLVGAVIVVVGALFLPAHGDLNSRSYFGHTYASEVILASIVVVLLAAIAASGLRGSGLLLAAASLVLLGLSVPVGPIMGLRFGVWVGAGAAAVAALAAIAAAKQMNGRPGSETTIAA